MSRKSRANKAKSSNGDDALTTTLAPVKAKHSFDPSTARYYALQVFPEAKARRKQSEDPHYLPPVVVHMLGHNARQAIARLRGQMPHLLITKLKESDE